MPIPRCLQILALTCWLSPLPALAQNGAATDPTPHAGTKVDASKTPVTKPHDTKLHDTKLHDTKPVQHAAHQVPAPAPPVITPAPPPEVTKPDAAEPASPKQGSVTGLALPRFAALKSDDVNLRVGPGTRYPIGWVYKRRDLPVEIEREYEVWRLVSDLDGNRGWVHQATLSGRRTFIVRETARTLRRSPEPGAAPVAVLKPGVIGRIVNCAANAAWCELQVGEYRGYLRREEFWGAFPGEPVN